MSGLKGLIALIAAFLVLVVGGALLYRYLSPRVERPNPLTPPSQAAEPSVQEASVVEEVSVVEEEGEISRPEEPEPLLLPDIGFTDWDGNAVRLSDFYGKPIVLNHWASWCPPCKSEMPDFQAVWEEMGGEVQFLMIDLVGGRETLEAGKAYVEEQGFTFPVYFDTGQEAAYTYGISSIPTTLFVDAEGYLVTGATGMISEEVLRLGIDMLLHPDDY